MTTGYRLCRECRVALAAGLLGLPALYDECGALLGGSTQPRDRTSGGPMPGMPFNTAAADVRASMLGVLGSWSGLVVDARKVAAPRRAVRPLVEFLGRHVGWLVASPTAAEFCREVAELARSARRVISPERARRIPVGPCVEPGCDGTLVATVRPGAAPSTEIICGTQVAHRWPERHWLQLSGSMDDRPSPRWLSVGSISQLWRIPPGSVYRLASEQKWRRNTVAGKKLYHETDVRQTFDKRKSRTHDR
ncbi:hypothetical protein [Actinokineospora cianjurensis]|uniref:Uncharacterized protein n=1 Tax=Actinokineospora cianjurensis TaxID=585224 RepID=A0A421AVM4_9PSEU|nr:hypothetical protein [Actinokineospora cianjurensis]RLK53963.1 hypothetical protein CLV68_6345 [Actinokineospora cianjurensis]